MAICGTYDLGKPRVRLLVDSARHLGRQVVEHHVDVWAGVEDKTQLASWLARCRRGLRWLLAYPSLIFGYLRLPAHRYLLVPYLGHVDVLVLAPLARLRGAIVLWDVFISLHDTVVDDRQLARPRSVSARFLFAIEWLAARWAHRPFLDTRAQARRFESRYRLPVGSVGAVPVGAESLFRPRPAAERSPDPTVVFYGQFIPLHGLDVLIEAARMVASARPDVRFLVIGRGQEAGRIDALLAEDSIPSLERRPWVQYEDLVEVIAGAWIGLGIFGTSAKASTVIPNKIYQMLAVGRPIITADTPAIRELLEPGVAVRLVAAGDAKDLAAAILALVAAWQDRPDEVAAAAAALPCVSAEQVGRELRSLLDPKTN